MQHVVVGPARALIVLVVLPRRVELREVRVELVVGWRRTRRRGAIRGVEWQRRRTFERGAHDGDRAEDVGPNEGGPGRDRRTRIVSHHHRDRAVTEGVDEPDGISHHVEHAKRIGIGVVRIVPAGRAAVAALIGSDHVIPRRCQRQHHLAPAIGELREAMQQQHSRPARMSRSRFQHVHGQAVDIPDRSGPDARRNRRVAVRRKASSVGAHLTRLCRVSSNVIPPTAAADAVTRKARRDRLVVIAVSIRQSDSVPLSRISQACEISGCKSARQCHGSAWA